MNSFQTARFGELQYAERDVITLPEGLVGLPHLRRWILLDMDRDLPLKWFQSLDAGAFGLPVTTPDFYAPHYEPHIPAELLLRLGERTDEVVALIITTVHPGGAQLTGNLAAPVLVNQETRRGAQVVLDDPRWAMRQEIDYVRFGLAAQATEAGAVASGLVATVAEGERQEIAL